MLKFLLLPFFFLLSACQYTPIPSSDMTISPLSEMRVGESKSLIGKIAVVDVTIPESAPSIGWVVTPKAFGQALRQSLAKQKWAASNKGAFYKLSANILSIQQGVILTGKKPIVSVDYKMEQVSGVKNDLQISVTTTCPDMPPKVELFVASSQNAELLKCALQENITVFMAELSSRFQ